MEKTKLKASSRTQRLIIIIMLCTGLPIYIYWAVTVVGILDPSHFLVELAIYAFAGIIWILPIRFLHLAWKRGRAKETSRKPGAETE